MALTAKKVYAILKRQISDMEAKLNSPVRYRGTVATADLLPLNPDIGDMYNIESKSVYGEAGMNVAWNGVVWDTMGAPIDMSLYIKSSELADWVKQQSKPTYTAEEVGALPADTKIPSKTSDLKNDSGFLTKVPDSYLNGTDTTLKESGKAADAKATGDKFTEMSAGISKKLDKNQGSENSGKIAGINEAGDIVPMFPIGVEYNEETNCLEFGSDQKMKLNQGIGLDSTLTKTGFAADAGVTGKEINSLKEDINDVSDGLKIYTVTPSWEQGNVTQNTEQEAGNKIRTGFIDTKQAKKLKTEISDGYVVQILLYDKTQKYISNSNKSYTGKIERVLDDEVYFIRMVVYRSTWGDIFPSDAKSYIENVLFYCPNGYVKTTEISKVNKAYIMLDFDYSFYVADKSVGDGGLMCVREDLLAEYGFKGTLAVNYTAMSSEMQQIILNTFKKYNWEYALYGFDGTGSEFDSQIRPHISDNSYIDEITSHLENCVNKFNEYGLYEPIIYFCRRNENGSALMEAAQNNGIKLMRAITFNEKEIETTYDGYEIPVNMTISTYQVYYNNFDWSSLKTKIDEHINNGGFMSIMTHKLWSDISKGSQSEDNTIENYRTILDYIKSLVDNGSVEVITWKDVYNIIHDENNTITKTDYNRLLKRIEALETA